MSRSAKTPVARGKIEQINVSAPGAGVEFSYTLPSGFDYLVQTIYLTFTASAVVASRIIHLRFTDGSNNNLADIRDVASITASQTVNFTYGLGMALNSSTSDRLYPLPAVDLPGGYKIQTTTTAKDAGDAYTNIRLMVRKWVA